MIVPNSVHFNEICLTCKYSITVSFSSITYKFTTYNGYCQNVTHTIIVSANRPERECPSRRYVFERHARKRLKLPPSDLKEIMVANRTECEDKCLNEFSFVCRSATYDSALRTCSLSRFTRRTHPELLEDDHNADYLENTCLNGQYVRIVVIDRAYQEKINLYIFHLY